MEQLAKALVAAQKDMPKVEPDAVNPHFKTKFVSLDHLIAKTRPVLNRHGLVIIQSATITDTGQPSLTTTILHVSGESVVSTMPLIVGKNDMQGLGAAITYARRYAWAAALGISADEDDDGNQASRATPPQPANKGATPDGSGTVEPSQGSGAASPPKNAANQKNGPTADQLAQLFKLVEERGGDVQRTSAGYDTAVKQGKVADWYAKAFDHWSKAPVASEFEKKAADAKAAGEKAQQARAAQAAADRGEAA